MLEKLGASVACILCHWYFGRQPKGSEHLATLKEFAAKLAVTLTPGMDVISIRVLFSPPGSPAQPFHLDYAQHFSEVRHHTSFC